ncbi:MAG: MBL fold metallo-hydrolase [Candidatus Thorarchaeota archaeon]
MRVGEIEVVPLASESLGVRSLCTRVSTPDVTLLLDPSAALAMRGRREPHPREYHRLMNTLERISVEARKADILSVSHYHYDHVRPGFTNFRYNLSSRDELKRMFQDKIVFAKDNRDNVNASQRRRGFFFEKDVGTVAEEIRWVDGRSYSFGETKIIHSHPLPHGPMDTNLGYVIATIIEHAGKRVLFAPDVQGPVVSDTLRHMLSISPDAAIVGGPPIYLKKFKDADRHAALASLTRLASCVPILGVDHHLMRSKEWREWLLPVMNAASKAGNRVMTMAEMVGLEPDCLENIRENLYSMYPPSAEFMNWVNATDEYKSRNHPPLDSRDVDVSGNK